MPFIDVKVTTPTTAPQKEAIKTALGQAVSALRKTESYLMVGIADSYDLWFAGRKLEKGAYVSVSLYGSARAEEYDAMTGKVCAILAEVLGIPAACVYVTYHPVSDWGWNGANF